mmetsp:Transcript_9513/g.28818  ORF Transcript_9513/g.28818 Transcript_9513/m.28818 type:complete len:263 (-) Transcript_9513:1402-2190(-)
MRRALRGRQTLYLLHDRSRLTDARRRGLLPLGRRRGRRRLRRRRRGRRAGRPRRRRRRFGPLRTRRRIRGEPLRRLLDAGSPRAALRGLRMRRQHRRLPRPGPRARARGRRVRVFLGETPRPRRQPNSSRRRGILRRHARARVGRLPRGDGPRGPPGITRGRDRLVRGRRPENLARGAVGLLPGHLLRPRGRRARRRRGVRLRGHESRLVVRVRTSRPVRRRRSHSGRRHHAQLRVSRGGVGVGDEMRRHVRADRRMPQFHV